MYFDILFYMGYLTIPLPLRFRVWCQHRFWNRRDLTPRRELADLRAFIMRFPRERDSLVYRSRNLLGNEEITIYDTEGVLSICREAEEIEPDGRYATIVTEFTIRSFKRPVRREVTCVLEESDDTVELYLQPVRRFPAAIVYADASDIRELVRQLRTWQRVDA